MITTPTTFVVGAGASVDLGLPTGVDLRKRALTLEKSAPELFQFLIHERNGLGLKLVQKVLQELAADTTAESIDEFLWSRQHRSDVVAVGRALIAVILGTALSSKPPQAGWAYLDYIIQQMRSGTRSLKEFTARNSQVRFVTFNFDGFIERRLEKQLGRMFPDAPEEDVAEAHRTFAVVHVHGSLPTAPTSQLVFDSINPFQQEWFNWQAQAVSEIRVVHDENIDATNAAKAVNEAQVLCFLGFNYHPTNLSRLEIGKVAARGNGYVSAFGSAKAIKRGRREQIEAQFGQTGIKLGDPGAGCLEVLEGFHIFR